MRASIVSQALLVFVVGAATHFSFDVVGRWPPLAWLFPVNESLWEHVKMAFWPALVIDWMLGTKLPTLRHRLVCTAMSACVSTLLIAPLFYGYTGLLGHHLLVADVGVFASAVGAGHWVAYRIAMGPVPTAGSVVAALSLAAILGIALVLFTYAPPPFEMFRDSLTGQYGLDMGF